MGVLDTGRVGPTQTAIPRTGSIRGGTLGFRGITMCIRGDFQVNQTSLIRLESVAGTRQGPLGRQQAARPPRFSGGRFRRNMFRCSLGEGGGRVRAGGRFGRVGRPPPQLRTLKRDGGKRGRRPGSLGSQERTFLSALRYSEALRREDASAGWAGAPRLRGVSGEASVSGERDLVWGSQSAKQSIEGELSAPSMASDRSHFPAHKACSVLRRSSLVQC